MLKSSLSLEEEDWNIELIFCTSSTCATNNARVSREAGMVQNLDYKELKDMNLCKFVLNELKRSVRRFEDKGDKTNTAEGQIHLSPTY